MSSKNINRIVIKLGTRLLTYSNGKLNLGYIERIVREIANLKNQDMDVLFVSSGAIGAGMGRLNLQKRPITTPEKQAVAAIGQSLLIQYYEKLFAEYGHVVAQVLLTRSDIINRKRYINVCNTLQTLLHYGAIPIINENDTVATEEIEFGDNDTLSALVAGLVDADMLVILTDIDGLYTSNPHTDSNGQKIKYVKKITPEIKKIAGRTKDSLSTGGMETKIQAAEIAVASGVNMMIASGINPGNISKILSGEQIGTFFQAEKNYLKRRKRWIAFGQAIKGKVIVDHGAIQALLNEGKSLLPSGIKEIKGNFKRGDVILISDDQNNHVARGIVNYNSDELKKIKGMQSKEIKGILGYTAEEEIIHRNNMVTGF